MISLKRDDKAFDPDQFELDDDNRLEIENRIRNLFWTVSEDYTINIKPDADTFIRSKHLALYDAIKQGAAANHFDVKELSLYILKKGKRGADALKLTELMQLVMDEAVYPIASAERKGIFEIRKEAFKYLLLNDCPDTVTGNLRKCIICRYLNVENDETPEIKAALNIIDELKGDQRTYKVIEVTDRIYDSLIEPGFKEKNGDLDEILKIKDEELVGYDYDLSMTDEMMAAVLERYLDNLTDEILKTKTMKAAKRRRADIEVSDEGIKEPDAEEALKLYSYMERQFGKSFLSKYEQEKLNKRLCTGLHKRCSLYYTEGILNNPAVKNTQLLRTTMLSMKNEMYFKMKKLAIRRNVNILSAMLKQVKIKRLEEDKIKADHGVIVPSRLWKIGKVNDPKLFDVISKRDDSDFVVDILLDSSGSQNIRQPQIAVQGYIISQALSEAHIPHRVHAFCSYWDYTMMHRFRDYDDGPEKNKNILQYRAFGENRDGLAIRAVCDSLINRSEEKKILIILSDGRPNNYGTMRTGSRMPKQYIGEEAIKDTAYEVRKARNSGISVLGIFVGSEEDLYAEKKIFGKEFTYTRNISTFAHIVGRYLRRQMEME